MLSCGVGKDIHLSPKMNILRESPLFFDQREEFGRKLKGAHAEY